MQVKYLINVRVIHLKKPEVRNLRNQEACLVIQHRLTPVCQRTSHTVLIPESEIELCKSNGPGQHLIIAQ